MKRGIENEVLHYAGISMEDEIAGLPGRRERGPLCVHLLLWIS